MRKNLVLKIIFKAVFFVSREGAKMPSEVKNNYKAWTIHSTALSTSSEKKKLTKKNINGGFFKAMNSEQWIMNSFGFGDN